MSDPGLQPDLSKVYDDSELEKELRMALKSEPEIDLFKSINRAMRVKDELANNEAVKTIVRDMWTNVAEFFDQVVNIGSIQELPHSHDLVVAHKDMQANFRAVAAINGIFKESTIAEQTLLAEDQMNREQQEAEL